MNFEELDNTTREFMLGEWKVEEQISPYRSRDLSPSGQQAFPLLIEQALDRGDEQTLIESLNDPALWNAMSSYVRRGRVHQRRINPRYAAERLGLTEFNTLYVRGFSARLIDEGVLECEVYRAAPAEHQRPCCSAFEGRPVAVGEVFHGHRAGYWPPPGDPAAFSIPSGPNCHHSVRRLAA